MLGHKRILLAGHEIGGQMQLLAEQLRKRGVEAHAAAFNPDFRKYETDIRIISGRFPVKRFLFFVKALFYYDVFHFFWGVSLLDFWIFHGLDLPLLRLLKKKVIVHFRGTDIFNIAYYEYLNRSALGEHLNPPPKLRPDQQVRLNRWSKYAHEIWVSTPDLKQLVPEARIIPQVIDVTELQVYTKASKTSTAFRIGHAPSRRNTKGTAFLIDAVHALQQRGIHVELDLIEGQLPNNVLERLAQCDVVVDQLLLGWYGKVTVEAMALGKPVICYINPLWVEGNEPIPVIPANAENIEQVLEEVIHDKAWRVRLSEEASAFVLKHHDVSVMIEKLMASYDIKKASSGNSVAYKLN
jgi:glycosyltransferase involved in cell wall biosynthesis